MGDSHRPDRRTECEATEHERCIEGQGDRGQLNAGKANQPWPAGPGKTTKPPIPIRQLQSKQARAP